MNFYEALAFIGISYGEELTSKIFATSKGYRQIYEKYMSINFVNNGIESGIIADDQFYAEALADTINAFGVAVKPERHNGGQYHYHNKGSAHFIHIWY